MKFSLLVLGLMITSLLIGQEKSELTNRKAFKIQGSYLFDGHPIENYSGFNLVNLGLMKVNDRKVRGLDLEGIFITDLVSTKVGTQTSPQSPYCARKKRSLELYAYETYSLFGSFKNGLYLGPLLSLGFVRQIIIPNEDRIFSVFQDNQNFLKIGAGFKIDYYLELSEKVTLTYGTNVTLLDFGLVQGRMDDPTLPLSQQKYSGSEFNFLRKKFPLFMGFVFLLGK